MYIYKRLLLAACIGFKKHCILKILNNVGEHTKLSAFVGRAPMLLRVS